MLIFSKQSKVVVFSLFLNLVFTQFFVEKPHSQCGALKGIVRPKEARGATCVAVGRLALIYCQLDHEVLSLL